jgi:long-chain acyl-CoA synthetase
MSSGTLCDIPRRLRAGVPKTDQMLYKEHGAWRPISSAELCDTIRDQALGLRALGVAPGDRIAILSENRPEWTTTDFGILSAGGITVPIYPTLLRDQVAYILKDSGARVVFVSTPAQVEKALDACRGRDGAVTIVAFDAPEPLPPGVRTWASVVALGAAARAADPGAVTRLDAAKPEDLASIIYTSGTTGEPKGVMLTHSNFVHNLTASCAAIPFQSSDVCLSVLPLSHIYERLVEYCYLHNGATIAYAESVETLAANLQEVRPTIVCCVPRLFEKMHQRILDNGLALPAPRRQVFRWALSVARACGARARRPGGPGALLALQRRLADRLVYRTIRERTGGRMRFFVSGSAPLGREVAEDLNGMGIVILEGYGQTECSPVIAVNRPDSLCIGSVGPPIDGLEVRLADDGEILVRGPSVMRGYYNNEAATRETIRDGWLHTGDIGRFDEHGDLVITDRKKEVLKTSGGKMIAPQPIENLLRSDRFIGAAVLIGDRRRFLSALIVPNFDQIRSYAVIKGIAENDIAVLIRHPRVLDLFERRIAALNERLPRFERVRRFRLLDRDFTLETGEVTPTLKPRRRVIEDRYRALIEEMYAEGTRPGS